MSKSRYGRKKGKSRRKSSKRSRAGKKAWRTKVRRYGSKAAAVAASFGKRGRRKGRRKHGKRKGRKSHGHRFSSNRARRFARNPSRVLAMIQKREGTTGLPPTKAETRLARIIVSRSTRTPKFGPTGEARREIQFKEKLAKEIRAEAARRAAYKAKQRDLEEKNAWAQKAHLEQKEAIEREIAAMK